MRSDLNAPASSIPSERNAARSTRRSGRSGASSIARSISASARSAEPARLASQACARSTGTGLWSSPLPGPSVPRGVDASQASTDEKSRTSHACAGSGIEPSTTASALATAARQSAATYAASVKRTEQVVGQFPRKTPDFTAKSILTVSFRTAVKHLARRSLTRGLRCREQLARIENPVGVERALDRTHQFDFGARFDQVQVIPLEQTHAVLGRKAAAVVADQPEDLGAELVAGRTEIVDRPVVGLEYVHVQVAVADMPEPNHLEIGIALADQRIQRGQKPGHGGNSHRKIVLVGRRRRNRFADRLTPVPEFFGLGLALTDQPVDHVTVFCEA